MMSEVSRETAASGLAARDNVVLAEYARILATDGVERGLIGPREVSRIWERHLLNCAASATTELVPLGSHVIDVGSGAGLPGVVWAIVRPDLRVTLLEPLLRRSSFLTETVSRLSLGSRVAVVRARAEDYRGELADVVTARAVAPLGRLAGWTLPLTRGGGRVVALKGSSVAAELTAAAGEIARAGGRDPRVVTVGEGDDATYVVIIDRSGTKS
ncbi:MAG: 16S rRNA (guanine(527)-N(7))-methyltransferase RsmG [Candidatus Nanopelagicales bacterium]